MTSLHRQALSESSSLLTTVDCQCGRCRRRPFDEKTYATNTRCLNCGWEGIAIHTLGHDARDATNKCPLCECKKLYHGDYADRPEQLHRSDNPVIERLATWIEDNHEGVQVWRNTGTVIT